MRQNFAVPQVDFEGANMPDNVDVPNVSFGPTEVNLPTTQVDEPMASGGYDAAARMSELYQPEHQATDRFNTLINSRPEYQRPSALRTIAASLSAFGPGGHQAGQQVINEPNIRAQSAWKDVMGPAQQAANIERQENVNNRTLAHQTVSNELRARADDERSKNNERNANIRQQRADIYDFKSKNPSWKIITTKGGNIQAFNPSTNETKDLGIPTGTLSETDKINLQADVKDEQIDRQAGHAVNLEGVKQTGRETLADTNNAAKLLRSSYSNASGRPLTPSQQKNLELRNAQQVINTDPELGKWVKKEPGGGFSITPPGEPAGWMSDATGPTKEQYDRLKTAIYGPMGGDIKMDRSRAESIARDPKAPKAPPGWRYVRKPGGGYTAIRE
jgi:hypothetical protein